jgi:hypothetical protein
MLYDLKRHKFIFQNMLVNANKFIIFAFQYLIT